MALDTITLHGEILTPVTNVPAVGSVTFKITQELRDNADNITYSPMTFTAVLDANGEFSVVLPVTDDPTVTPLDWSYWVYVDTDIWNSGVFYMQLPSSLGPVAEFADIIPVVNNGSSCTPDGTACAPIGLVGAIEAALDDLQEEVTDLQEQILGLVVSVNGQTGVVLLDAADVGADVVGAALAVQNALTVLIDNIDASQIVSGTLSHLRLGGDIPENSLVSFNRPTLVDPPTASDMWRWTYNGNRVAYINEFACFRARGLDQIQTVARFMSHVNRDGTTLPIFQVSLSDALTHLFEVRADGNILASGSLSMLPTAATAVTFVAAGAANAALINDGNVINTGAPYPVTTTLEAANRRVHLDGSMANTSGVSIPAQTTLFTVDPAHRPTAWAQFTVRTSNNLACRATVKGATGAVCLDQALIAGATVSFDGANWRKS